ncbi:MAG: Cof-type HAD-IIB family hydrolase [Clostridiales bacterium]|nr:Cof-type HAD-IIB family hydrolase [Clostridiales bacterium]
MIKYLAMDLDNTFLRADKSIPEENIDALKKMKDIGIKVVLSSGRSNMSLDIYAERLGLDYEGNYIIAYNGCRIYEAESKKVLRKYLLDNKIATEISGIVTKIIPNTLCYSGSRLYTENITEITKRYAKNSSLKLNPVDDLRSVMKEDAVQKIIMIGEHEKLYGAYEAVVNKFGEDINAEMFYSSDDLFEFEAKGKNKGTALLELAEILGESPEVFASIGDNQNDIEMIEYAGLGMAVANAVEGCKRVAEYVTKADCEKGGFAEACEYVIKSANRGKSPN